MTKKQDQEFEEKIIEYGPKAEKKDGKMLSVVIFALVLTWAAIIAAGIFINEKLKSIPPYGGTSTGMNEVREKLDRLEKETGTINEVSEKLKKLEDTGNEIVKKVESNKTKLEKLDSASEGDFLPPELPAGPDIGGGIDKNREDIAVLRQRLEKMEEKKEKTDVLKLDNALSPLLLAMLNLRDRIQKAMPYDADLVIVKQLGKKDRELNEDILKLDGYLLGDIVGIEQLREEFDSLAGRVVNASRNDNNTSVAEEIRNMVFNAFSIRRVGADIEGDSAEAIVARAEAALKFGNLNKAVEEVKKLKGEAAKVAQEWRESAERLIGVEEVFASMYERITTLSSEMSANSPAENQERQ